MRMAQAPNGLPLKTDDDQTLSIAKTQYAEYDFEKLCNLYMLLDDNQVSCRHMTLIDPSSHMSLRRGEP